MTASRRLILTRAADESTDASVDAATIRHPFPDSLELCHWPLITIGSASDQPTQRALVQAWRDWPQWQAVMWVSAAAARHFFFHRPSGHDWGHMPAWCTGPGTARELRALGVPLSCLVHPQAHAPRWDSEALWSLVASGLTSAGAVLRIRGREHGVDDVQGQGRDWLSDQLSARGIAVRSVASYERRVPQWDHLQQDQAQRALSDGSIWWFTSSQAVAHLQNLLPGVVFSKGRAVVTHERIAQACRDRGWGQVIQSAPDAASVMKSIESFE